MKKNFTQKIMYWHSNENKRIMPWKGEKDPYKIWISEIILQQTRVLQGLSYYNNFIKEFPTIKSLALANDESVFKVWEGLGYYSRCKNLLFTARHIMQSLDGKFPENFDNILALKGIGPYTAAAISSFAYGLPHAVVDGNVLRVIARYFGEAIPVDSNKGKTYFHELAFDLLFKKDPATYNQAIMDFGATVCKPQIPLCLQCVLQKKCIAYKLDLVNTLPVKEKELKKRNRWFTYFVFVLHNKVLINKRVKKDIWENLYEFYLLETEKDNNCKPEEINKWLNKNVGIANYIIKSTSKLYKQQLTHQNLQGKFIIVQLQTLPDFLMSYTHVNLGDLPNYAFPKIINQYLQDDFLLNMS